MRLNDLIKERNLNEEMSDTVAMKKASQLKKRFQSLGIDEKEYTLRGINDEDIRAAGFDPNAIKNRIENINKNLKEFNSSLSDTNMKSSKAEDYLEKARNALSELKKSSYKETHRHIQKIKRQGPKKATSIKNREEESKRSAEQRKKDFKEMKEKLGKTMDKAREIAATPGRKIKETGGKWKEKVKNLAAKFKTDKEK